MTSQVFDGDFDSMFSNGKENENKVKENKRMRKKPGEVKEKQTDGESPTLA